MFGEHTTQLGWYENKEAVQKEIAELSYAIRRGEASYTLKYYVEVDIKFLDVIMRKMQNTKLNR